MITLELELNDIGTIMTALNKVDPTSMFDVIQNLKMNIDAQVLPQIKAQQPVEQPQPPQEEDPNGG